MDFTHIKEALLSQWLDMAWCGHVYDYGIFFVGDVAAGKHVITKGVSLIHYC